MKFQRHFPASKLSAALLFLVLAAANLAKANDIIQPWRVVDPEAVLLGQAPSALEGSSAIQTQQSGFSVLSATSSQNDLIDEPTEEISAVAQAIVESSGSDPAWRKLFNHVTGMNYEHYYGCKKGAALTFFEEGGNDADLSTLLVAMLRSSGYEARYGKGKVMFPVSQHPSNHTLVSWLGVAASNIHEFSTLRGFPSTYTDSAFPGKRALDRVWVEVLVDGNWVRLDPAFKERVEVPPYSINESNYSRAELLAAAGGTTTEDHTFDLASDSPLRSYLNARAASLVAHLESAPISHESLLGYVSYKPFIENSQPTLFSGEVFGDTSSHDAIPQEMLVMLELTVKNPSNGAVLLGPIAMPTASLQGRRLSLTFHTLSSTGRSQLWLDDELLQQEASAPGGTVKLRIAVTHPWATIPEFEERTYRRGSRYTITYGFSPSRALIKKREQILDEYLRKGLANNSREVITEALNLIGLKWIYQSDTIGRAVVSIAGMDYMVHHHFGRVGQESAFYVDLGLNFIGMLPTSGSTGTFTSAFDAYNLLGSALEHAVIEQSRDDGKEGASTVKAWQLSTKQTAAARKLFYATSANWTTGANIKNQLTGYSATVLSDIEAAVNADGAVLLPQKGNMALNAWRGTGYMTRGKHSRGMIISGGLSGGFSTSTGTVPASHFTSISNSNPVRVNSSPTSLPPPLGLDPIDMSSGDYLLDHTDIAVGADSAPRGIEFIRSYHGGRRHTDPARLGYGWTHNWNVTATLRSAYEPYLGEGGSPLDAATMLLCAHIVYDLCLAGADARNLTLAGLTAAWGVDQMLDNAFSIPMGTRSLQFIKQPDGTWQPPPGVTSTLTEEGTGWKMQERHGNAYFFNNKRQLTSIQDLWGKTMTLNWNAGGLLTKVTDAYGGFLNFTYNGAGRLIRVTDNTGRKVEFTQVDKNLTVITDPEGKQDKFAYDDDNRVTEVRTHDNELIAINIYGPNGKVKEQLSQGLATRTWKYHFGSDFSIEEDPQGGKKTYFFDDRRRTVASQDEMGRTTSFEYDAQDRKVREISPTGKTQIWNYDNYPHPTASYPAGYTTSYTDQDGHTTTQHFNDKHELVKITDPLGRESNFTYNARHQVLTATNPANEVTTTTYSGTTGAVLTQKTPAETQPTTFQYTGAQASVRDLPVSMTLPTGGQVSWTRTPHGDPLTTTDALGQTSTLTYNHRREVLTSAHPVEGTTTLTYDNKRNVATRTSPGRQEIFTYSPTGKLLTSQRVGFGTTTHTYDTRDWLVSTQDPFGATSQTTYNAAGQVQTQTDPLGRTTTFAYDADGRSESTTSNLGRVQSQSLNDRGMVTSIINPLNHTTNFAIDAAGRQTSLTNRRNKAFLFTHDQADRQRTITTPQGRVYETTYNSRGLPATSKNPANQTTTFGYDAAGRVTSRVDPVGSISYTYDHHGNPLTITQGSASTSRTYAAPGGGGSTTSDRVSHYTTSAGAALTYQWTPSGQLQTMTYGPGKTVTYTYDQLDRLTGVADWAGHGVTITYHDAARRTVLTRGNNTVRETRRDAAGQVVRITDQLNPVSWNPNPTPLQHIGMNYDGDGRLVRKVELPTQTPTYTPAPTTASYNDDNALVTFNGVTILHDAAGRITSSPAVLPRNPPASVNQTYTWNARGQLTKVVEPGRFDTTYTYNPEGHRISTTHGGQTWHWTVDPVGAGMPRFITRQHQPTGVITHYIYAGDILLYQFEEGGGAARYYHYDHLGSTVLLTDGEGTATDRFSYSAYGETLSRTGSTDTPFQWLGAYGVQTDVTGLHHMRARYFHARLGRFLSEDPILFAGGQNWYAYAEGNPVMAVDPTGDVPVWIIAGAAIGAVLDGGITLYTQYSAGNGVEWGVVGAAVLRGAVAGAISSVAGPAAGTAARSAGLLATGTAAKVGSVAISASGSGAAQVANNAILGNSLTDGVGTASAFGAGGQLLSNLIPVRGVASLAQAEYFAPQSFVAMGATLNAQKLTASYFVSNGVSASSNLLPPASSRSTNLSGSMFSNSTSVFSSSIWNGGNNFFYGRK
jgi:RHS repeat-associated protein